MSSPEQLIESLGARLRDCPGSNEFVERFQGESICGGLPPTNSVGIQNHFSWSFQRGVSELEFWNSFQQVISEKIVERFGLQLGLSQKAVAELVWTESWLQGCLPV